MKFIFFVLLFTNSSFSFAQIDLSYEYKDYSKVSPHHSSLEELYFRADSIVFSKYDSIENSYYYDIHIKMGHTYTRFYNSGENLIQLIISRDSSRYKSINKQIHMTYDSICKKQELIKTIDNEAKKLGYNGGYKIQKVDTLKFDDTMLKEREQNEK